MVFSLILANFLTDLWGCLTSTLADSNENRQASAKGRSPAGALESHPQCLGEGSMAICGPPVKHGQNQAGMLQQRAEILLQATGRKDKPLDHVLARRASRRSAAPWSGSWSTSAAAAAPALAQRQPQTREIQGFCKDCFWLKLNRS